MGGFVVYGPCSSWYPPERIPVTIRLSTEALADETVTDEIVAGLKDQLVAVINAYREQKRQ